MKSEVMNRIIFELTGIDTNEAIKSRICPSCNKPIGRFRDTLSEKEFQISGLCQECQDSIFGGNEEETYLGEPEL